MDTSCKLYMEHICLTINHLQLDDENGTALHCILMLQTLRRTGNTFSSKKGGGVIYFH